MKIRQNKSNPKNKSFKINLKRKKKKGLKNWSNRSCLNNKRKEGLKIRKKVLIKKLVKKKEKMLL